MADIPPAVTTTLTAGAATAATTAAAGTLNAVQVAVAEVSQALQDLTRSIQTSATITAPPTGNTLSLSTALGNIVVTLPQLDAAAQQSLIQQLTSLAQSGRAITLGLQPGAPPTQAMLLLPAAPATSVQNATTTPPNLAPALPLPPLQPGDTLPALVLPTATPPATAPVAAPVPVPVQTAPADAAQPQTAPVPAGTTAPAAPPQTANAPPQPAVPAAPQQAAPQITAPVVTASAPTVPAPPVLSTLLQPGNEVTLHVDTVLPPSTAPQTLPPLASNQVAATVIGTGSDGQMLLKAGDATLFVKADASVQIGSTVILTVGPGKPMPLVTFPSIDPINFQALPQAMQALAQIDPQALQQMVANRLPQPNEVLPGALLLLFNAFKGGNVRGWLGDDVADSLLRAGKMEILDSLSRELGGAGQVAQDNVVGDWKSFPIPLYVQQHFQALTLFVHNENGNKDGKDGAASAGGDKIRFLIDMRLSKLGAMQLDGFVQPKKLDMILRSENLLPPGMHNDLRTAYIKAVGAVGYAGTLNFQVGRNHWLTMQRQAQGGIVT